MIQNTLKTLGGIESYGVFSLCLFGAVFLAILTWAALQRRSHLDRMARLPLDVDPTDYSNKPRTHE